jgi:arabinose-5-phosphate isomerase
MVMLKTLFEDQRRYLNHFFDTIHLPDAQKILEKLRGCKGIVIFSGVGKSGHIAEKTSATFLSTGIRSFFLSPANALHGDIGFISSEDVFISLSKSGNSEELIDLLPHVQKKGAATIAIVSSTHSKLAQMSDLSIVLPIEREICPYDLAPTTSAAAQLIFGDCLAVALMHARNFSIADFAANHPAGSLGRKITMKVADLMLKNEALPLCSPNDKLMDVLHELSVKRCGCLLVTDKKGALQGIFTDGDLRRAIQLKGPDALRLTLKELMSASPKSIESDQLALAAVKCMEEDPNRLITVLPVLEKGRVVGLVRMHDILQKEFTHL